MRKDENEQEKVMAGFSEPMAAAAAKELKLCKKQARYRLRYVLYLFINVYLHMYIYVHIRT